jgi:hypothetical protein
MEKISEQATVINGRLITDHSLLILQFADLNYHIIISTIACTYIHFAGWRNAEITQSSPLIFEKGLCLDNGKTVITQFHLPDAAVL